MKSRRNIKHKNSKRKGKRSQRVYKQIGCANCRVAVCFCCGKNHSCNKGCPGCGKKHCPLKTGCSCSKCGMKGVMKGGCGPMCGGSMKPQIMIGGTSVSELAYTGSKFFPTIQPNLAMERPSAFPSPNIQQSGGGCGSCGASMPMQSGGGCGCGAPMQSGGGNCKTSMPMQTGGYKPSSFPNGLIGDAWGGSVSKWPGVDGVDGGRNYLAPNMYKVDPQTQGVINERAVQMGGRKCRCGGRKCKCGSRKNRYIAKNRSRYSKRAGGLLPQDLVNLGRNMAFGLGSSFNTVRGYAAPVNPSPFMDQGIGRSIPITKII